MLKKEEKEIIAALRASIQSAEVMPPDHIEEGEFAEIMLVASSILSRPPGLLLSTQNMALKKILNKDDASHYEMSTALKKALETTEKWISIGLIHAELENRI